MDRTLVILKPNAVQRGFIGEVISRFEKRGLAVVALKMMAIGRELAERHYEEHRGKPFYEGLLAFITSAPSVVMVLEGLNAVDVVRRMCGSTDPRQADPGTIRGDLGLQTERNVIHASDSPQSAERETRLFFREEEILRYRLDIQPWL
jgi:nucleoside-diphosphate kinase